MDEYGIERSLVMSNYGVPVPSPSLSTTRDGGGHDQRPRPRPLWVSFLPRDAEITRKSLKHAAEARVVGLKTTFLLGGNPNPGVGRGDQGDRRRVLRRCEKHD